MIRTAYLDANVILRLLEGRPPDQARAALRLFEQAERGEARLIIHPTVLAEVLYVATSPQGLGLSRSRAASDVQQVVSLAGLEVPEGAEVLDALRRFERTSLDWVDCLLLSHLPGSEVYTFDREMIRHGASLPPPEA